MSAPDLGAAILASLDEETIRALAERLSPYLRDHDGHRSLLTPAETGQRLRLHPKTVVRMARDGRLPATKIGTGWRFHPDHLDIAPPARPARVEAAYVSPRGRRHQHEPASVRAIRGARPSRERSAA